jgi:hypothetical protein
MQKSNVKEQNAKQFAKHEQTNKRNNKVQTRKHKQQSTS